MLTEFGLMFRVYGNLGDYLSFSFSTLAAEILRSLYVKNDDFNSARNGARGGNYREYLREYQTPPILTLPLDVSCVILRCLDVPERVRMTVVCKAWRQVLVDCPGLLERPWLMLLEPKCLGVNETSYVRFLSMSDGREVKWNLHKPAMARGWALGGSAREWLLSSTATCKCFLLNIVTREALRLPTVTTIPSIKNYESQLAFYRFPQSNLCLYFIYRIEVAPISGSVVVLAIFHCPDDGGDVLAFCKPNDKQWTIVPVTYRHVFKNIIFYDGKFHICTLVEEGHRAAFEQIISLQDTTEVNLKFIFIEYLNQGVDSFLTQYFVKSVQDDLLLVYCFAEHFPAETVGLIQKRTTRFAVYRLRQNGHSWEKLTNLGEQVMFLSNGSSYCVPASDLDPRFGKNCIYFAWTCYKSDSTEAGTFYMEDGRIEYSIHGIHFQIRSPTSWFMPIYRCNRLL